MKTINAFVKVLTALAAVAGAVYIIATFGDSIVAWAKEIWEKFSNVTVDVNVSKDVPAAPAEEAAEAPAEEAVAEAAAEEAAPAEEPIPAEDIPVADESDFEG